MKGLLKVISQRDERYELIKKPIFLDTPLGKMNLSTFQRRASELPFGVYLGYDDVVCSIVQLNLPQLDAEKEREIQNCVERLRASCDAEVVRTEVMEKPHIKWFLIENLLKTTDWSVSPDRQEVQRAMIRQLALAGAEYRFLLILRRPGSFELVQRLLDIFGTEILQPSHPQLGVFNLVGDKEIWEKLRLYLGAGADINQPLDDRFGNTLLHYFLALEVQASALRLVDEVDTYHKVYPQSSLIDFTRADRFGKTPLLMAVGLNLTSFFNRLVTRPIESIGLNQADYRGRTPAMLAAALGRHRMLEKLLELGADLNHRDHAGRDIHWYKNVSIETIKAILKEYSVHPERSSKSPASYLYSDFDIAIPWVLRDKITEQCELIVMSGKDLSRLKKALSLVNADSQEWLIIARQMLVVMEEGSAALSVADVCREGHKEVQKLLNKPQVSSVSFFQESRSNFFTGALAVLSDPKKIQP